MIKIKSIIKNISLAFLLLILLAKNLYAVGYEGPRDSYFTHFNEDVPSNCYTGDMGGFDVFGSSNRNMEWVLSNPTCYGFIIGVGVTLFGTGKLATSLCQPNPAAGIFSGDFAYNAAIPATNILNFSTGLKAAAATGDCGKKIALYSSAEAASTAACATGASCAAAQTQAQGARSSMISCCAAVASFDATIATGLGILGGLYETADETYKKARICGHDWFVWGDFDIAGNPVTENNASEGGYWNVGSHNGSYSHALDLVFNKGDMSQADAFGINNERNISNKSYREFVYGGREFRDTDGGCSIPRNWSRNERLKRLGYDDENGQRYYMKGPGQAANYACDRFLNTGDNSTEPNMEAFNCCVRRSQNTICIQNDTWMNETRNAFEDMGSAYMERNDKYDYEFCAIGEQCMIAGVGFLPFASNSQSSVVCAKTNTLCPYDHLLGGGTEVRNFRETKNGSVLSGIVLNNCQVNKHCVKVPSIPYIRMNDYTSAYLGSACMNYVGHSQNNYSVSNDLLPVKHIKNFSAPLVECMSETMKNMIQNRAGHTKCRNPDESPRNGICNDDVMPDDYEYKEGFLLPTPSPFQKVQNLLRSGIKMVLVLSVTFLGYTTLLALKPVDRKTILTYVLKFAFVVYFALGTGWQDLFINSIFKVSSEVAGIVMKLDDVSFEIDEQSRVRLDGCQFPKYNARLERDVLNYPDPKTDPYYAYNEPNERRYAEGYGYLKPWDILDCKLVRSIGFGAELTVPNFIITILAGLLTGGLGIVFIMFTFLFAIFYLRMIIRAMHIFLVSTVALAILVFVSPITITAIMFQKTKDIFNKWLKQLIGFIIQPIILFAYLAIFIAIMDHSVYGIRHHDPDNGGITFSGDGLDEPKGNVCTDEGEDNSIYCIFGTANLTTYSALKPIGIIFPLLVNMNEKKLITVVKAGLLMFIFSEFMDKISSLAYELTGSNQISSNTPSAMNMMAKGYGTARGIQKRGSRGTKKAASGLASKAKRSIGSRLNKGKQAKGKDDSNNSKGGGESSD